jgi:RNA polymerase sigma factor (sigma-70 family)
MVKSIIINETQLSFILKNVLNENQDIDQFLIDDIKNGSETAKTKLYNKYYNKFKNIILSKKSDLDNDEINQILNDTFNKAITKIDSFLQIGSFEGWLKKILKNTFLNFIEVKKSKSKPTISISSYSENPQDDTRKELGKEMMELYKKFQHSLTHRQRTIFNLFLQGYKHEEIGKLMGMSESTSKWTVSEVFSKFKRWLKLNNFI